MSEMVEPVARAICTADGEPWDEVGETYADNAPFGLSREVYRQFARAAIEAHKAALASAGFVIVPREPTEATIERVARALVAKLEDQQLGTVSPWHDPEFRRNAMEAGRAAIDAALKD